MNRSKGLELPINTIVIVAIAVLVLVVAAAMFSSGFGGGVGAINLEQAYQKGCQSLKNVYNCQSSKLSSITVQDYKKPGTNTPATMTDICNEKFKDIPQEERTKACVEQCGC